MAASLDHNWVYVWRMYNRHHRPEAGFSAISPCNDSGYVWRMRNRHNRPERRSFAISVCGDWSYVWRTHNCYNWIDTGLNVVFFGISLQ
jgi:hypothetical protein